MKISNREICIIVAWILFPIISLLQLNVIREKYNVLNISTLVLSIQIFLGKVGVNKYVGNLSFHTESGIWFRNDSLYSGGTRNWNPDFGYVKCCGKKVIGMLEKALLHFWQLFFSIFNNLSDSEVHQKHCRILKIIKYGKYFSFKEEKSCSTWLQLTLQLIMDTQTWFFGYLFPTSLFFVNHQWPIRFEYKY